MATTTIKKLQKNKCYCAKQKKDIDLIECVGFDCGRWKKCMTSTNKHIDNDLKKKK